MISIIIPTLNEQAVIAEQIESLLDSPTDPTVDREILIVDGGSQDGTADLVRTFEPAVRLVEQDPRGPPGRGTAYNQAACLARGDTILFLHADTRLPPNGLAQIEQVLTDPRVIGGGFLPAFRHDEAGRASDTLRLVERGWQMRTRAFRWFAGDQAPFIRKRTFFSGGGYPVVQLAEDWAFAARLRSFGPVVVIERPVEVSARRHLANGVLKTLLVTGSVEVMYRAGIESRFLAWWYRHWLPKDRAMKGTK